MTNADLYVTQEHVLLIDGVLVTAGSLIAEYLRRYGPPATQEAPCAPLLSCTGARREIKSRLRSTISPWIDHRQKLDVIRDELEERGIALSRQEELV
jgi:hypothetical protein